MLFAVPDSLICGPAADGNKQAGCEPGQLLHLAQQPLLREPDGGRAGRQRRRRTASTSGGTRSPATRGNCWYDNTGAGSRSRPRPTRCPDCDDGTNPGSSVGIGNPQNEGELVTCFVAFETDNFDPESSPCPWFDSPPRPGSPGASSAAQAELRARQRQAFIDFCREGPAPTCEPFESR